MTQAPDAKTFERHNPPTVWPVPEAFRSIYAHAVAVPAGGCLLLVSGQLGVTPEGRMADGFDAQCREAMANVERVLESANLTVTHVVKATYYLTRVEDLPSLGDIRLERWGSPTPPAVTTLVVASLARADALVEIEVTAAAS